MKPLGHKTLDDLLLGRLSEDSTILCLKNLDPEDLQAQVVFEPEDHEDDVLDSAKITIDLTQIGLVRGSVHELLHVVLRPILGASFGTVIEETIVRSLEDAHISWLTERRERWNRWVRELQKKRVQHRS